MHLVTWTVAAGAVVFLVGLFSALGSRQEPRRKSAGDSYIRASSPSPKKKGEAVQEMAASGTSASQYGTVVGQGTLH